MLPVLTVACSRSLWRHSHFGTTGFTQSILWVYPDFECQQCNYAELPAVRCEVGVAEPSAADYSVRLSGPNPDVNGKGGYVCGNGPLASASSGSASGHSSAWNHSAQYSFRMTPVSHLQFGGAKSAEEQQQPSAARAADDTAWFSGAWVLDLDLDYFVPDDESPKMASWRMGGKDYKAGDIDPRAEDEALMTAWREVYEKPTMRQFVSWWCAVTDLSTSCTSCSRSACGRWIWTACGSGSCSSRRCCGDTRRSRA
jgi:hypothetical protein